MNNNEKRVAQILNGYVNDIDAPIFDNLVFSMSTMLRDNAEESKRTFDHHAFENECWGYDRTRGE
jgi:hypothetical protein